MMRRFFKTSDGKIYKVDAHQETAYNHLAQNKRAALFLGMSLQKTVVTLTYLYDMHYREAAISKTLVIAPPKVARLTWPAEVKKWSHLEGMRVVLVDGTPEERLAALAQDAEVYVISASSIVWLHDQYLQKRSGKWRGAWPFDSVVIDELTLFKSQSSGRFKAVARAIKPVEYRIGLTGTPAPNGYVDLWAQMFLLDGGDRLGKTFGAFVDKYFRVRGNGQIVYEYIPRRGALELINAKIADIALSMKTRDYKVLPDLHIVDEEIELDPFDKEVYDELERELCVDLLEADITVKTAADLTTKLLQISSGAIYDAERNWHEVNTAKLDRLGELLDEHPGETFIAVYQFRHEVDRVLARFPFARQLRKGKALDEDFADWNAGRIRLLLIHPAGAGHGLNLQFGGRRMVWLSLTWNLEHWEQTIARLLRTGAKREIYVHRLIVKGTRDGKVRKSIEQKGTTQDFLQNEIKALRAKYGK